MTLFQVYIVFFLVIFWPIATSFFLCSIFASLRGEPGLWESFTRVWALPNLLEPLCTTSVQHFWTCSNQCIMQRTRPMEGGGLRKSLVRNWGKGPCILSLAEYTASNRKLSGAWGTRLWSYLWSGDRIPSLRDRSSLLWINLRVKNLCETEILIMQSRLSWDREKKQRKRTACWRS